MKLIFAALLASFTVVLAQDKLADYRMVNGQLYNIQRSILWEDYQGDCLKVSNNQISVQLFKMDPVYGASSKSVRVYGDSRPGSFRTPVYATVPTKIQIGEEKILGKKVLLINYPASASLAAGDTIRFRAMQVSSTNSINVLDHGTPNTNTPAKPNPPKGTNVPAKVTR